MILCHITSNLIELPFAVGADEDELLGFGFGGENDDVVLHRLDAHRHHLLLTADARHRHASIFKYHLF